MSAHELCLVNLSIADAGPLDLIDAAAAAGFDSVNVWLTPPPSAAHLAVGRPDVPALVGDAAQCAAVRRRLAATGVSIWAASAGWLTAQFDRDEIVRTLAAVAALGGRSIGVIGWDPDRARLIDHLGLTCAEARALGLQIVLEPLGHSTFATLGDAAAMLAELQAPNAKLVVDALALARSGGTPDDVARVPRAAIASVQLCDAPLAAPPPDRRRDESLNGRLYPGEGELPLVALMAALPAGVVVEVETPVRRDAHLPFAERAQRCIDAARRFLSADVAA
jgi:sugar phosphate isomerase/epimerase